MEGNRAKPDNALQDLMCTGIECLPDDEALDHAGHLIDVSSRAQYSAGFDRALELLDALQRRSLPPETAALLHYFRANAWAGKVQSRAAHHIWAWEQPEHQEQILALRSAVRHEGFCRLPDARRCQILTNLANELSHIGRFVDAVELWDRALHIDGTFGMARGNRGLGLCSYANALYDRGQATCMLVSAHDALAAASAEDASYENAGYESTRADFEERRQEIAALGDIPAIRNHLKSHRYSLGKSEDEKHYRSWCLRNRLFMNPLNDLGTLPSASHDVLTLPSLTVPIEIATAEPPPVVGFFNQIKQEFVSARYLYYEGLHADGPHFSDRDVLLFNTLDYPAYSLATERMRLAFRVAYSILDKIGLLINEYFALGIKPECVSFRSIWYESKGKRQRPLLERFRGCENWPLRGLFWLSKDLFDQDFKNATEPDAAELREIRNHLEHKYLQLHLERVPTSWALASESDQLRRSLTVSEFSNKTLRILKLARAALTYLSLAVHCQEGLRAKGTNQDGSAMPLPLDIWPDEWKG